MFFKLVITTCTNFFQGNHDYEPKSQGEIMILIIIILLGGENNIFFFIRRVKVNNPPSYVDSHEYNLSHSQFEFILTTRT